MRRGRRRPRWLVLAALGFGLVELAVVIEVGRAIGVWPTVLLLVASAVVGSLVVRRQGARAWRTLRGALRSPSVRADDLADASLAAFGGVLMMLPGFVSTLCGLGCVLPVTRPLARALLRRLVARRPTPLGGAGTVIEGEVVVGGIEAASPRPTPAPDDADGRSP